MRLYPNAWLYLKVISHTYKFVYLRIPKCASTSMIAYIKQLDPDVIMKRTKRKYRGYFRFTVIRNDFDRINSIYLNLCDKERAKAFTNIHKGLYYKMPYDKFIEYILHKKDRHWLPINEFLKRNELDAVYTIEEVKNWPNFPYLKFNQLSIEDEEIITHPLIYGRYNLFEVNQ